MKKRVLLSAMLAAMLALTGCGAQQAPAPAEPEVTEAPETEVIEEEPAQEEETEEAEETNATGDIVILHTNDVHCGVDNNIGYAGLSAYKKEMEDEGNIVFLVDAGDEIQGGTMGTLTKGDAIINLMNAVGYQLAVPGNHEFDYGVDRFLELAKKADFPYVSCNFVDLRTGETVFDPYKIFEIGGKKIAFVGATTPTTTVNSAPTNFEDENGETVYGFMQDEDGKSLYDTIQKAVDDAHGEGAEYCILVAHLGIDGVDSPYTSSEVIENTTGIDAVFDGHSHSLIKGETVKNMQGKTVLVTQTGNQLPAIGKLTIDASGKLTADLIEEYEEKDEDIVAAIDKEREAFKDMLSEKLATTDSDMVAKSEDGETWLVRLSETNMADFVADAYKYATGADIAFVNGGGVRSNIAAGDITFEDLLNVNPFSNELCMREVSGQELLDALEYSVSFYPEEFGGFLQVSGITFDIDLDKDAKVETDEDGMFTGFGSSERRVSNVKINGEPIDPKANYKAASINYILLNRGNGYSMFEGEKIELDRYLEDSTALKEYIESLGGKLPDTYKDAEGDGRINFLNE